MKGEAVYDVENSAKQNRNCKSEYCRGDREMCIHCDYPYDLKVVMVWFLQHIKTQGKVKLLICKPVCVL